MKEMREKKESERNHNMISKKELAGMMDHTILKPFATKEQIKGLCKEALEIQSASVCVNPCNVELLKKYCKAQRSRYAQL
jgi:deoxyribose-phosphate aldolase